MRPAFTTTLSPGFVRCVVFRLHVFFFANTEICEEKGNVFGLRFISVIIIN